MDGSRSLNLHSGSVRDTLKTATFDSHQALHRHALFSRLIAPDLTKEHYIAANLALLGTFQSIEAARTMEDVWPRLHLSAQIAALSEDVEGATAPIADISLDSAPAILGALYVAHGSAFGARLMARAVAYALPDVSRAYLGLRDPHLWIVVCATLEQMRDWEVDDAIDGANAVFSHLLATPLRPSA